MDARALASPNLTVLLAGNKQDLATTTITTTSVDSSIRANANGHAIQPETPSSVSSRQSFFPLDSGGGGGGGGGSFRSASGASFPSSMGSKQTATSAAFGREVSSETASRWASKSRIPVSVEVSALSGENVDELFSRLARMILTKIELGEIDPDDPQSGIQYGDVAMWSGGAGGAGGDRGSVKSAEDETTRRRVRKTRRRSGATAANTWIGGMREWEDVFRISGTSSRRRAGCC